FSAPPCGTCTRTGLLESCSSPSPPPAPTNKEFAAFPPSRHLSGPPETRGIVKKTLFALGGAAAALAVVLLANATTYRTRQIPAEPAPAMALDTAAAAERLARAPPLRTLSFGGASGADP